MPLRRSYIQRGTKPMRKIGRRGKRNLKANKANNQFFINQNISYCERCNGSFALGKAHRFKRNKITTEAELLITVLLCQICHDYVDLELSHEEMHDELTRIINERETRWIEPA